MAGTSLLCQPIAPPHPQVLELTHLPKGLCMKSQQGWPHLSAFSLDFIQSTPKMVLSHLNMEILSQAEESALGKKKYILPFK